MIFQAPPLGGSDGLASLWTNANDRLRALGLPTLPVGGYIVEPAHLVIAIIALVMFGPMGLIVVAVLIAISQHDGVGATPAPSSSTHSQAPVVRQDAPNGARGPSPPQKFFSGSGQRLGS